MGVEVEGVETLMYLLQQNGAKAVRGAAQQMNREAHDIRDLARRFAPVDEGDLEASIRVVDQGGGRDEETGRFVRKSYVVEVDGDYPAGTNKEGRTTTVGDYAYLMHEYQVPFGTVYRLGKRSQAKQDSDPSVIVGGKFLERAVDEVSQGMIGRIIRAVANELD